MSFADEDFAEKRSNEDRSASEEAEAAAAEAAGIGGDVAADSDDPAEQPLIEAGQGEDEGYELAESDLIEATDEIKPD